MICFRSNNSNNEYNIIRALSDERFFCPRIQRALPANTRPAGARLVRARLVGRPQVIAPARRTFTELSGTAPRRNKVRAVPSGVRHQTPERGRPAPSSVRTCHMIFRLPGEPGETGTASNEK